MQAQFLQTFDLAFLPDEVVNRWETVELTPGCAQILFKYEVLVGYVKHPLNDPWFSMELTLVIGKASGEELAVFKFNN